MIKRERERESWSARGIDLYTSLNKYQFLLMIAVCELI